MRSLVITFLFTFSQISFADTAINSDIQRLRQAVDVGTNGGDTYLYDYDTEKFDYSKEVNELYANIRDSGCSYQVIVGRRAMSKNISSFASYYESKEAQQIVRKLIRTNKVKAALGYFWDGAEGDSEYCSKESMTLYLNDGRAITVDYDSTT